MQFLEVFKRRVLLMRVSGIPVRADYRWFFVIVLMSAITAASITGQVGSFPLSLLLGLAATLVFFASIFLHEFAHAVIARMEGLEVLEIVLHPFGGLARFRHPPETPRAEFRIAIAGPAASFLLTFVFLGLMAAANALGSRIAALLLFLPALSNFLLAVFNLFPGYPLDGGRVLRAFLWKRGKDLDEATILTGRCGQVIAALLIVLGIFVVINRGEFFTGFWAVLVGLFLFDAASGIIREVKEAASARTVDDIMQLPRAVPPDASIQHFVDHILTVDRRTVFPVAKDGQLFGMLILEDMKTLPREKWNKTLIQEVIRHVTSDHFVDTGTSLDNAREKMRANGIGSVCVIDASGKLAGFIRQSTERRRITRK